MNYNEDLKFGMFNLRIYYASTICTRAYSILDVLALCNFN